MCEHKFVYGGVKYKLPYQLPGSGAYKREYYDWYFCEKCLESKYKKLDTYDSSYDKVLFSASPMPEKE